MNRSTRAGIALALCAAFIVAAGFGGTRGQRGAAGSGASGQLKVAVLLYGPKSDGGWNDAFTRAMAQIQKTALGKKISVSYVANTPGSEAAAQLAQQLVARGANVLVDNVGLADVFTNVCAKYQNVKCFQVAAIGKLPGNVTGYYGKDWASHYLAGVAAGLTTKTGTVGFILPFEVPQLIALANSYALGCQSVRPGCKTRIVVLNNFFDPPGTNQAANTLINAGADVLNADLDDPSYCVAAQQRHVWAVGNFSDQSASCPKAILTSTVWNLAPFLTNAFQSVISNKFQQHDIVLFPLSRAGITLGPFGASMPMAARTKLKTAYTNLASGKVNPFKGPLYDQKGKQRVAPNTPLSDTFLYQKWSWYVKGVIKG